MSKKKQNGSLFGFSDGGGEDVYDFEFNDGEVSHNLEESFSYDEDFSKPTMKTSVKVVSHEKNTTKNIESNDKVSSENALERAQNMLNKYSSKAVAASQSKPGASKKQVPQDFNEDDISLGSSIGDDEIDGEGSDSSIKKSMKPSSALQNFKSKQLNNKNNKLNAIGFSKEVYLMF